MRNDIDQVLISETDLEKRISELGVEITKDYANKDLLVVGILKGANIFMSDLVRQIDQSIMMDFMVVSSYGTEAVSSGVVKIIKDLDFDIEGKDILIVEDIIDTGLTLSYLKEYLMNRKAASVKICSLLNKPSRRVNHVTIDYLGFEVPDEFIIGYGIDYAEHYRNLPFIGTLKRSVYEK
ncbi:hypoxanthine phosphoribosyltransferase [Vallitalea okinawensis]|uniref:hypoxanthine phosphoribosyltransferase n=1 Tax=Vallitalea okinawensis TaxID=2078660 RepID=UPI000CFB45D9|nr:hypoxanthine phosphoribosyltransferase [Vallitalea okinawensis]